MKTGTAILLLIFLFITFGLLNGMFYKAEELNKNLIVKCTKEKETLKSENIKTYCKNLLEDNEKRKENEELQNFIFN